jgi:ATP-dependent RNA helicase RhlB
MPQQPLTDIDFESFDLHPDLLSGLHASGFIRCTPIQALSLPIALAGKDVAGQAQTGTGKTAAFLVAVLNRLLSRPARSDRKLTDPRAIVVAPTRELAIQIDKDFRNIGRDTGLRSALIYGGVDYDKQRDLLRGGCDLIIATPGRLIDYLKQHVFSLNGIEAVVIDEADRMFDLGFIKDIRFLFRRMPPREERQSMLFSATLSHRVLELAYEHMNSPEKLTVETDNVTADRVRQVVFFPAREEKQPLLLHLLAGIEDPRGIVFVNTKIVAEKVTRALERHGYGVATLSGDVPQAKRERLLAKFQKGDIELLVATDVAARGLHIPAVSHVFNYDLPQDAEDYVHRIGRTARLGAEGDAVSFACDLYAMSLPDIEAYIGQKIPVTRIDPDMLTAPPARVRAPRPIAETDEEAAEDAARNTAGPPPKPSAGRRAGAGSRDRARGARGSEDRAASRRAANAGSTGPTAVAEGDSAARPGNDTASAEAPRKRRRRRGGRGRGARSGSGAGNAAETTAPAANGTPAGREQDAAAAPTQRKPRKPRRRPHATAGDATAAPNAGAGRGRETGREPAAAQAPAKPGLFRRIGRLFGRR